MSKNFLEFLKIISLSFIFVLFFLLPEAVFTGAKQGLSTWWRIILPSLLPFFILSSFIIKLGVVHFIGTIIEPLMRPLFNIPGSGAFALILGMTSGAPVNASITAQLRNLKILSINEGQRLIAFTSNSSLLFMVTAIAVGMLDKPELGFVIAVIHYGSNIIIGIIIGQISKLLPKSINNITKKRTNTNLSSSIINLFVNARSSTNTYLKNHYQGISKTIYFVTSESMKNILNIGGYIVIFSVLTELITNTAINKKIFYWQQHFLPWAIENQDLFTALITGIFETTVATELAAESGESLLIVVSVILLMLGWGGLSIHAQIMTVISISDINLHYFLLARILQPILSVVIFLIIPIQKMYSEIEVIANGTFSIDFFTFFNLTVILLTINLLFIITLICASLVVVLIKSRLKIT